MAEPLVEKYYEIQQLLIAYSLASEEYERGTQNYGLEEAFGIDFMFYPMDIHVLSEINKNQGITLRQLTEIFSRSKGYLSIRIKKMKEAKLIVSVENAQDHKYNHLYTTELGRLAAETHVQQDLDWCEEILEELPDYTEEEFERICKLLRITISNLKKHKKEVEGKQ